MLQSDVTALGEKILLDPLFPSALIELCTRLPACFRIEPRLVRAVGDAGSLITVAVIIAGKRKDGSTRADIQGLVVARHLASGRRVRAIVDELIHAGAVEETSRPGARRRHLALSGWAWPAMEAVAITSIVAASPWIEAGARSCIQENPGRLVVILMSGLVEIVREGDTSFSGAAEMALFAHSIAGYILMLEVMRRVVRVDDVILSDISNKSFARTYSVSRAHVTAVLRRGEALSFWKRRNRAPSLELSHDTFHELRRWLARHLAFIAIVASRCG